MLIAREKSAWKAVAIIMLVLFCTMPVLHATIPHEHPHDLNTAGIVPMMHSVAVEKLFIAPVALLGILLFSLTKTLSRISGIQTLSRFRRRPETLSRLDLFVAFSQGILHSKAY